MFARLLPTAAALLAAAAILAGCGGGHEASTPNACLEGKGPYLKALQTAEYEALLPDGTPIADCLVANQPAGDLARVGEGLVAAANQLNREARAIEGNQPGVELGILVATIEAREDETDGIHSDLRRRVVVSARYAPVGEPLGPGFESAYEAGVDAVEAGDDLGIPNRPKSGSG